MLNDNLGMRLNLPEDILVGIICTVRAVHYEDPTPAGYEGKPLERIGKVLWSPPLSKAIRLLERSANQ